MIVHVLKKSETPLHSKEIHSFICQYTNTNEFTEKQVKTSISNLCQSNNDIFLWDRGSIFAHRKHIPVDKPILILVEERIRQVLSRNSVPYISLYEMFTEYKRECESEDIPSSFALHACLKAKGIKGITFMRSPYLCYSNKKVERKNVELLDRWIAQKRDIVSVSALKRYAKEIGIDFYRFSSTFVHLKSVVKYDQGIIVHLDSLEWNQEKRNELLGITYDYWKQCELLGDLFARADHLLDEKENKLPKLGNGITWTTRLLFSLLSRFDDIVVFGNTNLAFGFRDGESAPNSLGDIVVRVLRDNFNGGARLRDVSTYFRNDLCLVQAKLTPQMIKNHPGITITEHEIYLSGDNNAS